MKHGNDSATLAKNADLVKELEKEDTVVVAGISRRIANIVRRAHRALTCILRATVGCDPFALFVNRVFDVLLMHTS